MISVVASILVKEKNLSAFLEIFQENVPHVVAEDGCIEYMPMVDADIEFGNHQRIPNKVTVLEKWESPAHLERHLQSSHMQAYRENVKDMVESVTLSILEPVR